MIQSRVRLTDTMYKRVSVVVGLIVGAAACGGDDSGSGSSSASLMCTVGSTSTPGATGDPCPQTGTACAQAGMIAVTTCGPDGTWKKDATGNILCDCVPRGGAGTTAGAGTGGTSGFANTAASTAPRCGDGMITPPEQCDGANLNQATCTTLGAGTGMLTCDPTMCRYNTSMCHTGTGVGGSTGH